MGLALIATVGHSCVAPAHLPAHPLCSALAAGRAHPRTRCPQRRLPQVSLRRRERRNDSIANPNRDCRPVQAFIAGGKLGADQISTTQRSEAATREAALATVVAGQKAENVRISILGLACRPRLTPLPFRSCSTLTRRSRNRTPRQISSLHLLQPILPQIRLTVSASLATESGLNDF